MTREERRDAANMERQRRAVIAAHISAGRPDEVIVAMASLKTTALEVALIKAKMENNGA